MPVTLPDGISLPADRVGDPILTIAMLVALVVLTIVVWFTACEPAEGRAENRKKRRA